MKIQGRVFEGISSVRFFKDLTLLESDNTLYSFDKNDIIPYYSKGVNESVSCSTEGLWIYNKKLKVCQFWDIFHLGYKFTDLDFRVIQPKSINGYLLIDNMLGEEFYLINTANSEKKIITYNGVIYVEADSNYIFIRSTFTDEIVAYDYDLNKIWAFTFDEEHHIDFELKPQIHNDLVIVNNARDTIALNKQTGEEVWKYTFVDIPTSNILMQGKIYAVCKAVLYVINPENGEVEWKKDTGYDEYLPGSENASKDVNACGIFPVGEYLYGVARWAEQGEVIRLYDKDLNLLHKTALDEHYINPCLSIQPTIQDDKIFQTIRNVHSYSGSDMVVMEITENESDAGIKVDPRPNVTIRAFPALQEPHKLQIFLEATTLDDTLRYGELLTQELHYKMDCITSHNIRGVAFDNLHNGIVELIIDDSNFVEQDKDDYFKSLEEKLKASINTTIRRVGYKKICCKFKLIRQHKKDWDVSGEKLDWAAIRDQEIPLGLNQMGIRSSRSTNNSLFLQLARL
jgi:hypothetical protein